MGAPERDRSNGEQGATDGGPDLPSPARLSQRRRGPRQLHHPPRPHRAELHPLPVRHRHRRRSRQPGQRSASRSGTAPPRCSPSPPSSPAPRPPPPSTSTSPASPTCASSSPTTATATATTTPTGPTPNSPATATPHAADVVIDTPSAGATFAVSDTVSFTGHATASDGSPIPPSQLQWDVQLRHCPQGICHLHPLTQVTGTGGSISFPDHGDDSHIDIKLTATDGAGRSASLVTHSRAEARRAHPRDEPAGPAARVHRCDGQRLR